MECAAYINSIALEKESVSVQYCVSARAFPLQLVLILFVCLVGVVFSF